jgi:hypothetical protein
VARAKELHERVQVDAFCGGGAGHGVHLSLECVAHDRPTVNTRAERSGVFSRDAYQQSPQRRGIRRVVAAMDRHAEIREFAAVDPGHQRGSGLAGVVASDTSAANAESAAIPAAISSMSNVVVSWPARRPGSAAPQ